MIFFNNRKSESKDFSLSTFGDGKVPATVGRDFLHPHIIIFLVLNY